MHARHRSPGNGYRSVSGGVAAGSRISPESSFRGRGTYNSDYRSYNRGFGRGQNKPSPSAQAPRRTDIFMEAGRLATEYLVSKGLLPQNVLSVKWQNGGLKNQMGGVQDFRQQEADGFHPPEGRTSAHARLGAVSDGGLGRRRLSEDYLLAGTRSNMRGRRRFGSFKSYDSDWGREAGRSGSSSDTPRGSPDTEGVDSFSGYKEEKILGTDIDIGGKRSSASELVAESDGAGDSESAVEKFQSQDDTKSGKGIESEANVELVKTSEDTKLLNENTVELKNDSSSLLVETQSVTDNIVPKHTSEEDNCIDKNSSDLLSLCRFAKVPTRTRSALLPRGSKADPTLIPQEEKDHDLVEQEKNISNIEAIVEPDIPMKDVANHDCLVDAPSNELPYSRPSDSEIPEETVGPAECAEEMGPVPFELRRCSRSASFPDGHLINEQKTSELPPGFGRCSSLIVERGEKRAAEVIDTNERMKKRRDWFPSVVSHNDAYLQFSNLTDEQLTSREDNQSPCKDVNLPGNQEIPADMSLFQTSGAGPCIDFTEEKQLFPGSSFKICDLNLMEANENTDPDPNLIFQSIPKGKMEATSIDVGLSISNHTVVPDKYGRLGSNGKEVEVIDLENDYVQEDKTFSSVEKKGETVESFPSHVQSANDISDNQDGYGLMISELLGTDIANCSSVPPDMNSLHNDMSLHNEQGILGDDESIYMSLEEIPISFLRVWEQPTQEYDKPF